MKILETFNYEAYFYRSAVNLANEKGHWSLKMEKMLIAKERFQDKRDKGNAFLIDNVQNLFAINWVAGIQNCSNVYLNLRAWFSNAMAELQLQVWYNVAYADELLPIGALWFVYCRVLEYSGKWGRFQYQLLFGCRKD